MPVALYALTAGAFGIGVTEFVIMGLLLEVSRELNVTIAAAGLLISGYALGVTIGAPVLTALTARWPRKHVLLGLMVIFVIGNAACALAPTYGWLMAARVLTALGHRLISPQGDADCGEVDGGEEVVVGLVVACGD